jgi:hypothetical protein
MIITIILEFFAAVCILGMITEGKNHAGTNFTYGYIASIAGIVLLTIFS